MKMNSYISRFREIPWFENVGKPSDRDREVFRIYDWSAWPGPEDPAVSLQNEYYLMWQENLCVGLDESAKDRLEEAWDKVETAVLEIARLNVPYDEDQDAWYAPNAAVWSGSWIAALVACTFLERGKLDEEEKRPEYQWTLSNTWSWFEAGHWPCSFYWTYDQSLEGAERTGAPKRMVVY